MDLDKQAETAEYPSSGQFQQQRSKDARANAELLLKMQTRLHSWHPHGISQNLCVKFKSSGGAAETPNVKRELIGPKPPTFRVLRINPWPGNHAAASADGLVVDNANDNAAGQGRRFRIVLERR